MTFSPIHFRFAFIFFFMTLYLMGCSSEEESRVCYQKNCFEVEVADNEETRTRGLQYRESMEENEGMLFVFPQSKSHVFWMKDTYIPLDIIWIDHSQCVVHIEEEVPPCEEDPCARYTTPKDALYVLELNMGTTGKVGLKVGDRLDFHFLGR